MSTALDRFFRRFHAAQTDGIVHVVDPATKEVLATAVITTVRDDRLDDLVIDRCGDGLVASFARARGPELTLRVLDLPAPDPFRELTRTAGWTDAAVRHALGLKPSEVYRAERGVVLGGVCSGKSTDCVVAATVAAMNGIPEAITLLADTQQICQRNAKQVRDYCARLGGAPQHVVIRSRSYAERPLTGAPEVVFYDNGQSRTRAVGWVEWPAPDRPGVYVRNPRSIHDSHSLRVERGPFGLCYGSAGVAVYDDGLWGPRLGD